jgi:large-conductance mechanosensitive channel
MTPMLLAFVIAFAIFIVVKQLNRLFRLSGENLPK